MPAGITKKSKMLDSVPGVGDPDRKRVLNVLAQRRYRQRRRERLAALEAQAQTVRSTESADQVCEITEPLELESIEDSCPSLPAENIESIEEITRAPLADALSLFDFDTDPDNDPFTFGLPQDFQAFPSLPTPLPSTPTSSSTSSLNSSPPLPIDSSALSIPILASLHAFARIATALDLTSHIWDPTYLHVLPPHVPALTSLPSNLHPVAAQCTIPHHPVIDLLPWPSVREKLICMLSMPSAFRPPVAREESSDGQSVAIVRLVQDLDDLQDGGGVRVHGNMTAWDQGNELVEEAWEVGDVFYKKWWWCLDQRIVEVSNRRRRERGLGQLRMVA